MSIITGVNRESPFSYNVVIGVNPKVSKDPGAHRYFYLVSRINQMVPPDHINLNGFLEKYREMGWYVLLPVHYINDQTPPEPFWKYGIAKRALSVREAWEIGPNDPDAVALKQDEQPLIPDDVKDAPVLRTLTRWAKR